MLKSLKIITSLCALSLLSCLVASTARADDAAKPAKLPQLGFVAVKSIDAATAFAKQVGLDLPPQMSAAGLEQQFVFIGKGGLATDRPIGIVLCGGPGLSAEQTMAFVFPVTPAGGTLDSLKALGGTAMPDHADTVLLGGVGLRRTADYLIFSPNPAVAVSVNTDAMVDALKNPDALAKVAVDFKTLRKTMPDEYKAMMDSFEAGATKDGGDKEVSLMFVKPIEKTIDAIDRLDVDLSNGEQGLRLALTARPLNIATAAAAANRPGMPAGVFARADMNFAPTDSTTNIRQLLQKAFNQGATSDATLSEENKKKLEGVADKMGGLLFDPAATSMGVEIVDGSPVLYLVQHWSKAVDAPKEWKYLMEEADSVSTKKELSTEEYADGGTTIERMTLKADQTIRMDVAQKENDVFITISPGEGHVISKLLAAQPEGPMKGVFSGYVDLGKSADAALKFPGSPLPSLPAQTQEKLDDLLKGQKIMITTSSEGDAGTLDLTITKGLLENIPKLMEVLSPPAAEAKPDAK